VAAVEGLAAAEAAQAEQKLDRADSGNQAESAAAQQQQQQQQQPGQHRLSRTSSASIAAPTLPPTSAVGQDRGRARRHARGHGLVEHIPSGPHACFELVLPLCYPIKTQAQQPQGGAAATGQQVRADPLCPVLPPSHTVPPLSSFAGNSRQNNLLAPGLL
jgi:hypothetical protein